MPDLSILILRLGIGIMFIAHGLQTAFGFFGGPAVKEFSVLLGKLGFYPALFWAYLGAYTELLGGLLLVLGLQTRAAAMALLIFIVTAGIKVHISKGFFLSSGGFEYTFVIASVCFALILSGPGKYKIFKK